MGCLLMSLTGTLSWHRSESLQPTLPHRTARTRLLKNLLSCQACGRYQVSCASSPKVQPTCSQSCEAP